MVLANESKPTLSLVSSLQEINKFIKGGEYSDLKQSMKAYDRRRLKFYREFYLRTICADKDYQAEPWSLIKTGDGEQDLDAAVLLELERLLAQLDIPKHHWGRYLNSNLSIYRILCQLNADLQVKVNIQVNTIIELLDERKNHNRKFLIIFIAASVLSAATVVISPFRVGIIELAKLIMTTSITFPIFGILLTLASAVYYGYQNCADEKRSLFNRIRDNGFLLLKTALNLTGNIIWLSSAAVVAPVASVTLFLLSSVLDVVKEVFATIQNYSLYKGYQGKNHLISDTLDLHEQQEHARYQIGYRQHRNAALINTAAAVLLLALMVAWQFVPGGLFATIGAIALMGIIYQGQRMVLKSNSKIMRDELQNELRRLEQEYEHELVEEEVSELVHEEPLAEKAMLGTKRARDFESEHHVERPPKRVRIDKELASSVLGESKIAFFSQGSKATPVKEEPQAFCSSSLN